MVDFSAPILEFELAKPLSIGSTGLRSPSAFFEDKEQLSEHALSIADEMPDDLRQLFRLLRLNVASGLHVKGVFVSDDFPKTPHNFTDTRCDPAWFQAANITASLARAVDIHLCSYCAENNGSLFVHLVPAPGQATTHKSRSQMRGHTDGVALPFPAETGEQINLAPSPDTVILIGLRNPDSVPTNIAPLSTILRNLKAEVIRILQEPLWDFTPQASFKLGSEHLSRRRPILMRDQNDGYMIRFSHSNVDPTGGSDESARTALERLKEAIAASFQGVTLKAGDILFVNNRTALHGRAGVGAAEDERYRRWLLRTYGMYTSYSAFVARDRRSYELLPLPSESPGSAERSEP